MSKFKDYLKEGWRSLVGTTQAAVREGAKDLHNAIVPAFPDSQRGVDEPGLPTTPTSREVYEQKNEGPDNGYKQHLAGYSREVEQEQDLDQGMER